MATAEALLARGKQVRMVNRSGKADAPTGVSVVKGDVYDAASVRVLTQGAAAVYQCAQPGYTEWTTKFLPMQTAIIAGVANSGAKLIVAENLYMYGEVAGQIHEDLPYAAHTRKGRVRAQMAEQLLAAHRSGQIRYAAARGSDFYGERVRGSLLGERVFEPALRGKAAQLVGRLDLPHSYSYIGDFGATLAILGERDEALGQHWHVPNAPAITQREVVELIYQELGHKPQMTTMGRVMLMLGGLFIPEARETVEMLYEFERPFVADGARFAQQFNFQPTPIEEGIRRTVAWYKAQQATTVAAH
jgi:nucleoside-diphosphate-sugar epimerase